MLAGWHLVSGQGYTLIDGAPFIKRGPILPGLLGILTIFLGRDTELLVWAVRFLALLNPLLAYFLVKRISHPVAGLVAAVLVTLLSYTTINQQAFNIDNVLLTVYLLTLLVLLAAIQRDTFSLALLSGLLLGVSILTKETAFVNLPLALLAVLLFGWSPRRALWHYLGVALVCLPWWIWVYIVSEQVYMMGRLSGRLQLSAAIAILALIVLATGLHVSGVFARFLAGENRRRWTGWSFVVAWTVALVFLLLKAGGPGFTDPESTNTSFEALRTYAATKLAPNIAVWPLLPVAAGYTAWKAIRGSISWRLFAIALLFQSPILILVTVEGWNQRQFLIPQTLLLCALAVLIVEVCGSVARELGGRRFPDWIKGVAAILLVIYPLAFAGGEIRNLLYEHPAKPSVGGAATFQAFNMTRWMSENIPEGQRIVTVPLQSNYLAFVDGGRHEWKLLGSDQHRSSNPAVSKIGDAENSYRAPSKTVWIKVNKSCRTLSYSVPNIMYQTGRKGIEFLMITDYPTFPGLLNSASVLTRSGAFKMVHRNGKAANNEGFVLLGSTGRSPESVPTIMSVSTVLSLKKCEQKAGADYETKIRSRFPNGIVPVPDSNLARQSRVSPAKERYERVRRTIKSIYQGTK